MKKGKVLKNLTDRRAYKLLTTIDQDPYSEEFWGTHKGWGSKTPPARKWKKKVLYVFQYRMYRTWKHNRKTKYKL